MPSARHRSGSNGCPPSCRVWCKMPARQDPSRDRARGRVLSPAPSVRRRSGSNGCPQSCLPSCTLQRLPHPSPGCAPTPRASVTSWHYTACTLQSMCPSPCRWGLWSSCSCHSCDLMPTSDLPYSGKSNRNARNSSRCSHPRYTSHCNFESTYCAPKRTLIVSLCHRSGNRYRVGYRPRYTSQMTSSSSCNYGPMRIPLCHLTSPSRNGCTLCARSYRLTCTSRRRHRLQDRARGPKPSLAP